MNKKLLRTSVIASVMAMAFTASAWAAEPETILNADRLELTDGVTLSSVTGEDGKPDYTVDFRVGEVRAVRGVFDSYKNIDGDDGVVVGLQKHGSGKAIVIDENGQVKETGSFDTTNTTLFDLMNEYGNVGTFVKVNEDGTWEVTPNAQGGGNRDGVGLNPDENGKFETIIANYVGTPNFETNNLAIENAIRLDTSNSDRFGEGAAQRNGLSDYESTIFEANYDYFGVEHFTDTDAGKTSATMKIDSEGTNFTGQFYLGYEGGKIAINETNRPGIISGLQNGDVTANSTDAINGAQLHEVINTSIVEKANDHEWRVAKDLNGIGENNFVTIKDTTLVASDNAVTFSDNGLLTVTVEDTDGNKVTGTANIKDWADNNYAAKTVNINGQNIDVTEQVVNNYNTIQNHETRITENNNEIDNIKKNSVTKVVYNNNDTWTIEQKIGGEQSDVTIKDTYVTGINHALDANGNLVTTVQRNQGKDNLVASVKIGDAAINYNGQTITNNDDGSQSITNNTIEQAINNNYNKIVNVEDNSVSYISSRTEGTEEIGGKTYNVEYYEVTQKVDGQDVPVKIKDTTLVEKRVFADSSVPYASADNALSYTFEEHTGVPQVFVEFEDTSGNVVQGAIDVGSLMVTTIDTTDGNIEVEGNGQGFGKDYRLADNVNVVESITVDNTVTINDSGINMNNTNITNLAPGEVSSTSTEAINGSQLWQTNQDLDRLGTRLDKVGAGAAALAALHPMDFDPDDKLQFSAGVGNYRGETAAALGAFYRPTEKVMFSVAGTMGNGENMVNAGVTFALDRKNNVSNSRVAMAHEIQDLRDQVAALTALVSQIAGKGNPMLDTVMFPDVPENHWAYDYVESLQKRGIIEGYPDGNFAGDRSMTRYEYAAMLYRALEKGFPVDGRLLKEFEAELGRIRIDRIKGADEDANKVERVRVNDYEDRDDYGTKLAQVVADAAPSIEEPAA